MALVNGGKEIGEFLLIHGLSRLRASEIAAPVVLAAASAFALHDSPSCIKAPRIALMATRVLAVLDGTLHGGVALPALTRDETQIILGDVANESAVALMNALKLGIACEMSNLAHLFDPLIMGGAPGCEREKTTKCCACQQQNVVALGKKIRLRAKAISQPAIV